MCMRVTSVAYIHGVTRLGFGRHASMCERVCAAGEAEERETKIEASPKSAAAGERASKGLPAGMTRP